MTHLNTALTNIRRSPYQNLAAVLLLSITFFVGYTFSLFMYSADYILKYFETRPQIIAFFELETSSEQISTVEKTMQEKSYVESTTVIDKDKALEIYQENNKEDPLLLELVTADILPASIEVSGKDVESLQLIKSDLEEFENVDEVVFQQNIIDSLKKWTMNVRLIGIGSIVILSLTSLLTVIVMTAMKISGKRNAINIMRMIGATKWYIKAPYVYEGMMYGILSSLIGWGMMYIGLLYLTPSMKTFLGAIPLLPIPDQIFAIQLATGTSIGIILTALASAIAVQRVMRK